MARRCALKKCGSGLCGFVAATRGAPGKDVRNPDPAKRSRSVLGIEVLMNLQPKRRQGVDRDNL